MCTRILSAVSCVCFSHVSFMLSSSSPCKIVCVSLKTLRSFKFVAFARFLFLCHTVFLMGFANNTPDWKNVSPVDSLHAQSARRGLRDTDQQQFHSGSVQPTRQRSSLVSGMPSLRTKPATAPRDDDPRHQYGKPP